MMIRAMKWVAIVLNGIGLSLWIVELLLPGARVGWSVLWIIAHSTAIFWMLNQDD